LFTPNRNFCAKSAYAYTQVTNRLETGHSLSMMYESFGKTVVVLILEGHTFMYENCEK